MFLDKEAYERAGLVGKPYGAKGNRGLKPRWVVEFDLRSPSMFTGKKGFDRLVYAARNVFDVPMPWLFCHVAHKGMSHLLHYGRYPHNLQLTLVRSAIARPSGRLQPH